MSIASAITQKQTEISTQGTYIDSLISALNNKVGGNSKSWTITLASDITSNTTLVSGDTDVASHYADTDAMVQYYTTNTPSDEAQITMIVGFNKSKASGSVYQLREQYATSWGVAQGGQPISYSSPSENHAIYVNSNGDIMVRISGRPIKAGTIKVIFTW